MLKVKYLELNPSNGHYRYRSHNFNVIPEKIKALGQKIQTGCTSNALTIHIAKDKSTDITSISSPLHKRIKTSVPVAESIPGDDDRPLTPMDVDEEGTDDDEREILIKLIPSVVETMKNHGQLETYQIIITISNLVSGTEFQCMIYIPKNKIFNLLQFWRLKLTRNTMPYTCQKYTFDA
jgi:hypothetical protein